MMGEMINAKLIGWLLIYLATSGAGRHDQRDHEWGTRAGQRSHGRQWHDHGLDQDHEGNAEPDGRGNSKNNGRSSSRGSRKRECATAARTTTTTSTAAGRWSSSGIWRRRKRIWPMNPAWKAITLTYSDWSASTATATALLFGSSVERIY